MSKKSASIKTSLALALAFALTVPAAVAHAKSPAAKAADVPAKESMRAAREGELIVSDTELNHFIFPAPVVQVVFTTKEATSKPTFMDNNRQVLVRLTKGFDGPLQMFAEVEDGRVFKVNLVPRPVAGITHRFSAGPKKAAPVDGSADSRLDDVELLKLAVTGELPEDFERVKLPEPTSFENFSAIPLQAWKSADRIVMAISLVAAPGKTAVVAPPQFYRPGVLAVMIDGDHVSDGRSPTLYVVEEIEHE